MRVLWFTWKDREHPQAGGAELVNEELARRLAADGHTVTFVVGGFRGASARVERDGFTVRRVGSRWSVYLRAWLLYRRELRGTADVVIDEINTMPFFARWYVREPSVLFVHQLCREIWFHEMVWPLSWIGYALEPLYLSVLSGSRTLTISESTRADLGRFGFAPGRVLVLPQGMALPAVADLAVPAAPKAARPTLLAFGSARSMKRTLDAIRAFELLKPRVPTARLVIAGSTAHTYGERVCTAVARSPYRDDIELLGKVEASRKAAVLAEAHVLLATSVKEGWCLVVSEAAGQGTPAVAYDVDGLRDSIRNGETGVLVPDGDVGALAAAAEWLLRDQSEYEKLRRNGRDFAAALTSDASYAAFAIALHQMRTMRMKAERD